MPLTFYGFGAAVCYAGGKVTYNGTESFDAVECTVLLDLPFLPLRAVHTFNWNESKYQFMEIRWSPLLLLRAFLLRWLALPLIGGNSSGMDRRWDWGCSWRRRLTCRL
jgi:hypothetical protein